MKDGVSFLILILGIAGLGGAIIAYMILAPFRWTPTRDWLMRSLLSGLAVGFGFVVFMTSLWLSQTPNPDYGKAWSSFSALAILIVPVGIIAALGSYIRVLTWSLQNHLVKRFLQNRRSKRR